MNKSTTLIIGAGLAGLTLAQKLKGHHQVLILEKSRGLGGRIATRRIENLGMDHGAPYLELPQDIKSSMTKLTFLNSLDGDYLEGGMGQLPKEMAIGTEILRNQKASIIQKKASQWEVQTEEGANYLCDRLVITAPMPQAIELLDKNSFTIPEKLRAIHYSKALMLLMIVESQDLNHSMKKNGHLLMPMNLRKLHPHGLVLRANPEVSEKYFDAPDEEGLKVLHSVLKDEFQMDFKIRHEEYKKWRYCTPLSTSPLPFYEVESSLFLIGDSFLTPNSIGAIHSANALADLILSD